VFKKFPVELKIIFVIAIGDTHISINRKSII